MAMSGVDLAASADESELADLEQLWHTLDLPGHRIELISGQIIVSPTASRWHSGVVDELMNQLFDAKRKHAWRFHTNLTVHIALTRERLIPDLMVAPASAPGFGDDEILAAGVLLVAEVVSASSRRQDRETKNRAYAQGGIPLYLIIDKFTDPATVTLFSSPRADGYRTTKTAPAGQILPLPEPFGIGIDTARLLGEP